jgi:hypothetical protein
LIVTSSPHQQLNLIVTNVILGVFGINHMTNPTPELRARTSSYSTPEINNEQLLLLQPVAHGTAAAADAAGTDRNTCFSQSKRFA